MSISEQSFEEIDGGRIGAVEARVGPIRFKDAFSDPTVNIMKEREVADHEVVTGHSAVRDAGIEFIVQALGENPAEIEITGWITEDQLELADRMTSLDYVVVVTGRWIGTAVPRSVDTDYSRVKHDDHGWIFETTFDLVGVARNRIPSNRSVDAGGRGLNGDLSSGPDGYTDKRWGSREDQNVKLNDGSIEILEGIYGKGNVDEYGVIPEDLR